MRKPQLQLLLFLTFFMASAHAQQPDTIFNNSEISDSQHQLQLLNANIDSLQFVNKFLGFTIDMLNLQVDSLTKEIDKMKLGFLVSGTTIDTLERQKLRALNEIRDLKLQNLNLNKEKADIINDVIAKENQLKACKMQLQETLATAAVTQSKLEGKIDVNSAKAEGKDKEIAYLQTALDEKNKMVEARSKELSEALAERKNSLRIIDSLAREVNARDLQLVKVNERLRIIESQYNELMAQRAAATNKKKKIRFVQGVGLKNYRTPDWQLAPQSSASTSTYVITNKNSGKIEFDYITGVSLSLYDLSKPEGKFTYDAGLFVGFGGTNLFKNFYIAPSVKAFDYFHFMAGFNIAEYQQLQKGFAEGDALPGGMNIPTVKEWKANFFFGMTIDFELLANIPKKM